MLPRFLSVLFISSCLTLFIACDDDSPDATKPALEITILQNGDLVDLSGEIRGVVDLSVVAEDNGAIKSIRLFVNDVQIKEEEGLPTLETSLDTRSLEDKVNVIKVVVEDQAGNTAEHSIEVTIRNLLFFYTFPVVNRAPSREYWLILSDSKGKVFDHKKVTAEIEYRFLYPLNYAQNDFDLTIVQKIPFGDTFSFLAETLTQMPPGTYVSPTLPQPSTFAGKYSMFFTGLSRADFKISLDYFMQETLVGERYDFSLARPACDLFISYKESSYYYNPSVQVGESLAVDQNFIDTQFRPFATTMFVVEGANFDTQVNAVRQNGRQFYCSRNWIADKIVFAYPLELKQSGVVNFSSSLSYRTTEGQRFAFHFLNFEGIPTTVAPLDAGLSEAQSTDYPSIKMSFTGNADRIRIGLTESGTYITSPLVWTVNAPFSPSLAITMPDIPTALMAEIGFEIPVLKAASVVLRANNPATGYDQFCRNYLEGPPAGSGGTLKQKTYYFDPASNPTGRIRNDQGSSGFSRD